MTPTLPASFASAARLRTRILCVVGWTMGSLTLFSTLVRSWIAPLPPQIMVLACALSLVLLALPMFGSVRHWTPRLGRAVTLVSMVLVLSTGYLAGGLEAPVTMLLTVSPLLGVVLVGRRFGVLVAGLVIAALAALVVLHRLEAVPPTLLQGQALLAMRAFMMAMGLIVIAAAVFLYDQHSHDLVQRFQRDALTDALTGLSNRRFLELEFYQLEQRAAERGGEVWMALVDVDHFKQINDTHGHEAGDLCLQQVAMALRKVSLALPESIVARIAGDEFVVATVGRRGHLRALMDKARATLAALPGSGRVSISVGMAGLPVTPEAPELLKKLLARADAALYRAKKGGRGRIVVVDKLLDDADLPTGRRSHETAMPVAGVQAAV